MPYVTSTVPPRPRPRENSLISDRLARSLATTEGCATSIAAILDWLAQRRRSNRFDVRRIPFTDLVGWSFQPDTGNLVHDSGRFFTVEGLHVDVDEGPVRQWEQPIIRQPEVGILGILAKEIDGVLHLLMQAKMEPGNPNLLQLSPTVQATRSNYSRVHRGSHVRYLEYFTDPGRGRVLADVMQSEHGSWFYHKSNRNIIVEAVDEVPLHEDFQWLTLGQISELLHHDNLINMDARTVLACAPVGGDDRRALHPDTELLSWFTTERARRDLRAERILLAKVRDWRQGEWSIEHVRDRYFQVVAVAAAASNREVTAWTQPMFEPKGLGVTALLHRLIDGVPHLLVRARVEAGFLDTIELGPTVQCIPESYDDDPPRFLDAVLNAAPERIRYEAVHSEEGGRFLNAVSRYLIVDADESEAPLDPPPGFRWVTPGQLNSLVRHGRYLNVQGRTLLACYHAMHGRAR